MSSGERSKVTTFGSESQLKKSMTLSWLTLRAKRVQRSFMEGTVKLAASYELRESGSV